MKQGQVSDYRKTIRWLGFNDTDGKSGVFPVFYCLVLIVLLTNSVFFLVYHGHDMEKTITALKGVFMYIAGFTFLGMFFFNWGSLTQLIKTVEEGLYYNPKHCLFNETDLKLSGEKEMNHLKTVWYHILTVYGKITVAVPLVAIVFRLIHDGIENLSAGVMYANIPFYFPENHETWPVYIAILSMQSLFFVYAVNSGFVVMVSAFNGMQLLKWELKLLTNKVRQMDSIIENNNNSFCTINIDKFGNFDKNQSCFHVMDTLLRCIIEHHRVIYSRANDVTKGLQLVAFANNTEYSILLCITIYKVVKMNKLVIGPEAFCVCMLFSCLYCYGMMGENISSEHDNLRTALYESMWYDKPHWFKTSIQIIMIRLNREMEMKPYGLVVLNLKSFLRAVQAAYSYFNVLSNL